MMRLIFSIVLFILAGAIFFVYTEPAYSTSQATSAQVAQYNDALDKATQLQQLKQTLLARYNSFNPSDLDRLQTLLPDSVNNIGLILDLDSIARTYGLALQNVDVSSSPTQTSTTATQIGGDGMSHMYQSLTLTFSTQGTYDNFVKFIGDLQSSLRIVDLVSLSIVPATDATQIGSNPVFTYNITLRTYWLP